MQQKQYTRPADTEMTITAINHLAVFVQMASFFFRKERERLNYKSAVYHREEKRNIICNKSSIIDAGKKQTIVGVQKTNTHQTNCNRARHNLYGGRRIYKNGASIILTQCVTHTQMHFCFLFFFLFPACCCLGGMDDIITHRIGFPMSVRYKVRVIFVSFYEINIFCAGLFICPKRKQNGGYILLLY